MFANGYGMGFGSFFMWAIWLLVIFSIYALFKLFITPGSDRSTENSPPDSLEILKQRYARGEIDDVQFSRMKKDLSEK